MSNDEFSKYSVIQEELDDHEQTLNQHDERISKNERHRLKLMGALQLLAYIIGSGFAMTALVFIADKLI